MKTRPFTPNREKLAQAAQDGILHPGTPFGCRLVGSIPLGDRYELRIDLGACQGQPPVRLVLWDVMPGDRPVPTQTRICLFGLEVEELIGLLQKSSKLLVAQTEVDGGDR